MGRTLVEKIWDSHTVHDFGDGTAMLYIDRLFLHERTGSIALASLIDSGRVVANPAQCFATMDHIVDTRPGRGDDTPMSGGRAFIESLRGSAHATGIRLFDINDPLQGISHVIAAEQGIALPGLTMVCPDSHTCTLGALGLMAWGIGTSECEQVLATEQLRIRKPAQMRVTLDGALADHVTAKDVILGLISAHGASGGAGHAVEFAGPVVAALPVEARFTLCNMAVEFAAFTGIMAPDERVIDYLAGRPCLPEAALWDRAVAHFRTLRSDDDARFDREVHIDCSALAPMVTWGTSPEQACGIHERIPDPATAATAGRHDAGRALDYMGLSAGTALSGLPVDAAFIGSCTNSRLSDLRAAADYLAGRRVAPGVRALCVPGSSQVKRAAEQEGLDRVFREAGFEWRESGCSLCFYAGGEGFEPGNRVISTTNRNFEGRQGPGVRTHLASPLTVAASAVAGCITAAGAA